MKKRGIEPHFMFSIANFALNVFIHYRVSRLEEARERMMGRRMMVKWLGYGLAFIFGTGISIFTTIGIIYNKLN